MFEFEGWRCVSVRSGDWEAILTVDVGPRVIGLRRWPDGENLFYVKPETAGRIGGADYRGHGGHRLWVAPEVPGITDDPENDPVELSEIQGGWRATTGPKPLFGKTLTVTAIPGGFEVMHEIEPGPAAPEPPYCAWAITVMRAGGVCRVPLPPPRPHGPASLQPVAPLVLWAYTHLGDPRFAFHDDHIALHQDPQMEAKTKFGLYVEQGVASYELPDAAFVKQFEVGVGAGDFPIDLGCNFEAFTRQDMLEVESLAPATSPSRFTERWRLFDKLPPDWIVRF